MTFLPIVTRELRVASRRAGTYWSRFVTAVIALIAALIAYVINKESPPHELGQDLFQVVSILAFIYCVCVGVRATADCLSEEKRDGTLGLLFLTDLKGYDVVGGKLVATSLNAFYGLTAIFPLLAIPLLMGGVTNGEFWRMALVLANTFLFSLSVGMLMSAFCKSPRTAMAMTFVLLLIFTLGLPACEGLFPFFYRSHVLTLATTLFNPITSFGMVPDLEFRKDSLTFWRSAGIIHSLFWLFLAVASFIVPRSWQDHPPDARSARRRELWHRWSFGDNAERVAFRRRLLDHNAFYWLAGRARLKPLHVWAVLTVIACFWTWGALENGSQWTDWLVYFITAIVLNTVLKLWVTSEAGRRLGEDRKLGALELVLSTPLDVKDILRGQFLALRRQFLWPLLAVVIVEGVFLVATLLGSSSNGDEAPFFVACGLAIVVMLVLDLFALSAVAMWVSLTARNPNRTTGITIRRVLVLPFAIFLAILVPSYFIAIGAFPGGNPDWKFVLAAWFVPGLLADLFFGLGAWRRLQADFREVAAQRYTPSVSRFRRWFTRREPSAPESR